MINWMHQLTDSNAAPTPHDDTDVPFKCVSCVHYKGDALCDLGIFIHVRGCDMSACWGFLNGKTCRHCGRVT